MDEKTSREAVIVFVTVTGEHSDPHNVAAVAIDRALRGVQDPMIVETNRYGEDPVRSKVHVDDVADMNHASGTGKIRLRVVGHG